MPGYRGHLVGGFFVYLVIIGIFFLNQITIFTAAEWLACTLLGSLFPDIDISSKGQKIFYRVLAVVFCILLVQKKLVLIACTTGIALIPLVVRHRGIFHSPWFICVCGFLVIIATHGFFPSKTSAIAWDMLFFCVGALSHLWLDFGLKRMFRR